jgi:hypothetical protein
LTFPVVGVDTKSVYAAPTNSVKDIELIQMTICKRKTLFLSCIKLYFKYISLNKK